MREEAVHLNKHEAAREALAQEVIPPRSLGAKLTGDHLVSCFILPVSIAVIQYWTLDLSLRFTPTVILTRPTPGQTYSIIKMFSKER